MPPFVDVSDILVDPDLADSFTVNRRNTSTDVHGRVVNVTQVINNVIGVVNAASGNDLERHPEIQLMGRHLSIVTRFRLTGPAQGVQPDIIQWQGDYYVVQALDPYPQYGVGFVQAIVGSIDSMDVALPQPETSAQVFGGVAGA
jgi:hypothetical protein